jgi:O-antigen biosynthesis protein
VKKKGWSTESLLFCRNLKKSKEAVMNERWRRLVAFWSEHGTVAVVRLIRAKIDAAIAGHPIFNEMVPANLVLFNELAPADSAVSNEAAPANPVVQGQPMDSAVNTDDHPLAASQIVRARFLTTQPLETYLIPKTSIQRVSLVTDSIGSESLFGGVGTALLLAAQLANRMNATLRIVTRTQIPSASNAAQILSAYGIQLTHEIQVAYSPSALDGATTPNSAGGSGLDIHPDETFITTSWWTTAATLPSVPAASIIYLLQEDERMFYPFGDDRIHCERILSNRDIRFLVNTRLLYDHLIASGLDNLKHNGSWFEPSFPKTLFHERERKLSGKKKFFFYARPNNLRNLFYVGIDIIERAVNEGILDLEQWDLLLVGKHIPNVAFGNGYVPERCEGLDWKAYADLIGTIDLGFCLMYTPHPSYPPLDLAASNAVVVTNKFANKQDLSNYSRNIICAELNAEALLSALRDGVALAEDRETRARNFAANGLGVDWTQSFEPILQLLTTAR